VDRTVLGNHLADGLFRAGVDVERIAVLSQERNRDGGRIIVGEGRFRQARRSEQLADRG
jgi:hypothetical protein